MSASICTPYDVFEEPKVTLACFVHAETLGTNGRLTDAGRLVAERDCRRLRLRHYVGTQEGGSDSVQQSTAE